LHLRRHRPENLQSGQATAILEKYGPWNIPSSLKPMLPIQPPSVYRSVFGLRHGRGVHGAGKTRSSFMMTFINMPGYRQLSLLLRVHQGGRPTRRYFYLHSRLLERAARLGKEFGGGSLTHCRLSKRNLGYVCLHPDNVISITDGQITLTGSVQRRNPPAINVGLSVSGRGWLKGSHEQVAGKLRLELAIS